MNQSHSTSRPGPSFVIGNEELENWEPEFLDKFFRKRSLISLGANWNKRELLVGSGIPPPCPHAHAPTLHPFSRSPTSLPTHPPLKPPLAAPSSSQICPWVSYNCATFLRIEQQTKD